MSEDFIFIFICTGNLIALSSHHRLISTLKSTVALRGQDDFTSTQLFESVSCLPVVSLPEARSQTVLVEHVCAPDTPLLTPTAPTSRSHFLPAWFSAWC